MSAPRGCLGGSPEQPVGFMAGVKTRAKKRSPARGGRRAGVTWKGDTPSALAIGGRRTLSGERVTAASAMRLSAWFGGIRNISEDLAKLPKCVVEKLEPRGSKRLHDHPVSIALWDDFNPFCDAMTGVQTITQWALGYGNGVAEIELDERGQVVALWPIHPSRITLRFEHGRPVYQVRCDDLTEKCREPIDYDADELIHLRGIGDQWQGWSMAQLAAESIGLGLAARGFAAAFFGNDTAIGNVVTMKGRIPKPEREAFRTELQTAYQTTARSHGLLVLDNDATLSRMGLPPQDAQFIETQEFTVEDIARFLRVPPHKLQHHKRAAGWSTNEASNVDYVTDCLMPWAVRWEKQIRKRLLALESRRRTLVFFFQGQMRGDFRTRTEGYKSLIACGAMTPNEARELEDMNPSVLEGADHLWMQGAMAPIHILARGPVRPTLALPPGAPPDDVADDKRDPEDKPPPEEPDDDAKKALVEVSAQRVAAKVEKAYARHASKHADDVPGFQRWSRSFFEGIREDLVAGFAAVLGDRAAMWAAARVNELGKRSLEAFAGKQPMTAAAVAERLVESATEILS